MGEVDSAASTRAHGPKLLSVIAPVLDEEDTIEEFHRRVGEALRELPYELILVDDGSSDSTPALLAGLAESDPRVRVVTLSRNFGHQAALSAGLERARGEAAVTLDSDLQDPPELIGELVDAWRAGADVVYAVRRERAGEGRLKLATANAFYRLLSRLSELDLGRSVGDFRLLDRRALEALLAMPERNRFLRGMTVWVGFNQTAVAYDRDPRYAGRTKFSLGRMLRFSFDGIASFSHAPLQLAALLGIVFSVVAFLGIPVAIGFKLAGQFVPGITTILLAVLLLGGIQLITLGVLGEYVGRIYEEVKGRPLYVVAADTEAVSAGGGHGGVERERTPG